MLLMGYMHDGRAEQSKRAVGQPKKSLPPLGWKGQREDVVLPEPGAEAH